MKQALIYTAKIFLTTVIFGPFILVIILAIYIPSTFSIGDTAYALLAIPAGLILCLPSWLILWWLATWLSRSLSNKAYIKIGLSIACLPLSILPFGIMNYRTIIYSNYWPDLAPWLFTYAGITIIGIWVYKLQTIAKDKPTPVQ